MGGSGGGKGMSSLLTIPPEAKARREVEAAGHLIEWTLFTLTLQLEDLPSPERNLG